MSVLAETRSGRLEGIRTPHGLAFLGIPYARAPEGARRFAAPEPPVPWAGVRPADRFGPSAPQNEPAVRILPATDLGPLAEDCLSLNVWTPALGAGRRPVLVWIHGGGFTAGAGSRPLYVDSPLVSRGDAVLVTINYRLGALGFSHLAELGGASIGAVSNAGLRDQICALEWVRDHAAVFGGDPGNVTIFGESAGGMSVGTLLGTPSARGLFARAIPQSGAAHHVHSASNATEVARVLLDELGIRPGDLGRLREVPVDALLKAQMRVIQREQGGSRLLAFQPVVDGELLPAPPLDAVQGGLSARVPLLVGTTRDEWNLFLAMDPRARDLDEAGLEKRVDARVPGRAREIMELYRRERAARGEGVSPPELWSAIETDRTFRVPATRLADAQRRHQPRTFLYRFDWPSPALGGRLRACHALEVPFVFGTLDKPGMDGFAGSGPAARGLSERMMDAWLAFARGAEPRHAGLPEWPEHDEARRPTLLFDAKDSLALAPDERERRVWDGLL